MSQGWKGKPEGSYNGVRINGKDTNGWYQCRSMNGGQYTVSKLKLISCSLASPMCLYYQACGRPPCEVERPMYVYWANSNGSPPMKLHPFFTTVLTLASSYYVPVTSGHDPRETTLDTLVVAVGLRKTRRANSSGFAHHPSLRVTSMHDKGGRNISNKDDSSSWMPRCVAALLTGR